MKNRTLHPLLQRLAALILLGVVLGAAISSIALPVVEAIAEHQAASDRLARYQQALSRPAAAGATHNPADLAAARVDEPDAQLALQAAVDRLARGAGLAIQSTQPLAAEHLGDIGRGAWMELTFAADLQAVTAFLTSLDSERPLLLVRRLEIDHGEGPRPDLFLGVHAQIGQAWRPSGAPS
jgi:Type II secretion system (T2SS), protein M subtype b